MPFRQRITTTASEDRLESLLELRAASGTKTEEIDRRIWDLFGEDWAILFTDLAGFSKGAATFGIVHFLQMIQESHRILIPLIESFDGILIKSEADSLMVIFRNPNKALNCALAMQKMLAVHNEGRNPENQIGLCAGLGFGHILKIGDADVFGAEVNYASKLGEDIARSGQTLITDGLYQALSAPTQQTLKVERQRELLYERCPFYEILKES